MSYTKHYTGTQEEKDQKAMEDIRFYLGDLFEKVEKKIIEHKPTFKEFAFSIAFLGIQGYTVEAWARKHGIEIPCRKIIFEQP